MIVHFLYIKVIPLLSGSKKHSSSKRIKRAHSQVTLSKKKIIFFIHERGVKNLNIKTNARYYNFKELIPDNNILKNLGIVT